MQFYISWSHSDAYFTDYFPNSPVLISAIPDNRGRLISFQNKPKKVIIDCGSVFYVKQKERPSLKNILQIQLSLLDQCARGTDVVLVHYDEPMMNKHSLSEKYSAMERTLFNAYEYMNLYVSKSLNIKARPMGVIQGYDKASIEYSAHELIKMGYQTFGIGSLLTKHHDLQINMIKYAADIVGSSNLHVFGVTGLLQIRKMIDIGIKSFDSTRPTMAAAYFQVFYSKPFRTFFLPESHAKLSSPRLNTPLPCDCPICKVDPNLIFIPSPRDYMKLRSIHNYYHLVIEIKDMLIKKEGGVVVNAFSDVLRPGNRIHI